MRRHPDPRLVATLAALLLTSIAVGCGGGSSESSDASSGNAAAGGGAADGAPGPEGQAEIRACLEEQGVELPSPPQGGERQPPGDGGAPPGGSDSDLRAALEECGVDPAQGPGGPAGSGGRGGAPFGETIEAFAACVRENGFDLPDPNTSGDGPVFDPEQVDQEDPAFKKASRKCQDELRPDAPGATDPGGG
jgi:hypothetical protein